MAEPRIAEMKLVRKTTKKRICRNCHQAIPAGSRAWFKRDEDEVITYEHTDCLVQDVRPDLPKAATRKSGKVLQVPKTGKRITVT